MSEATAIGQMLNLHAAWYDLCASFWRALRQENMAWAIERKARLCRAEMERLRAAE